MNEGSPRYVFDAFALLAWLHDEPGAPRVQDLLQSAAGDRAEIWMSSVNLGEVAYTSERRRGRGRRDEALSVISQLPIEVVAVDGDGALAAAQIKATTGMGYLDCFVVALAAAREAAVVTGDPGFRAAEHLIRVEWLPQRVQ